MRKSLQDMPSSRRSLHNIRTLLLSSERSVEVRRLVNSLRESGMLIEMADDQYDAMNKLKTSANLGQSWRYELILIDAGIHAPSLSSIIAGAREIAHMRDVQVLVLNVDEAVVDRLDSLGVDYIIGSIRPKEVKQRIERLLDVEQSSSSHLEPADEPVPRLPDDHMNWFDKQEQSNLVIAEDEVVEAAAPAAPHTKLVGRVLVVEDNPVNQAVVKKMLEKAGLTPVTANDGAEALEVLRREQFDVVLMDCQMPRMDGYEATEAIREREARQGLMRMPVIAMTANAMAGDRERCLAVGMDDYLSKPVKLSQLENMLRQWLPMEELLTGMNHGFEASAAAFDAVPQAVNQAPLEADDAIGEEIMAAHGIIDRSVLKELYEIMEDDFVSVIESYLKSAPGLMHAIRDAVKAGDMDDLVKAAHPLKSSSANVGAMELSTLARELEFKGREHEVAGLVDTYNRTAEIFRRSVAELRSIAEQGRV